MSNYGARAGCVVGVLLSAACGPESPQPVSNGTQAPGVEYETDRAEQAETTVVASKGFVYRGLVAGFNDKSVEYSETPEIEYLPSIDDPQERRLRRGVSLMGWSTSSDAGKTWRYRGKVRPPEGWSAIWADPEMAVDPAASERVYYVQMGISDESWNQVTGGADETLVRPNVDGLCIARSTDSGLSFPAVKCFKVKDFGDLTIDMIDRTAITVDGVGRVWVAVFVVETGFWNRVRLFRSASTSGWSDFQWVEVPTTVDHLGDQEPALVTDSEGNIWLSALFENTVIVNRYSYLTGERDKILRLDIDCGVPQIHSTDVQIGSGQLIRNAHSYDIAAGLNERGVPAVRIAAQVMREDKRVGLRVVEWTETGCVAPAGWSTLGESGKQFQPAMSYQDRDGVRRWWLAFLSTRGVPDVTDNYVHPEAFEVSWSDGAVMGNRHVLAPTDWYACPENDGYWGDYFGLTQARDYDGTWWAVAAFSSSSRSPQCGPPSDYIAQPLHVAASRW